MQAKTTMTQDNLFNGLLTLHMFTQDAMPLLSQARWSTGAYPQCGATRSGSASDSGEVCMHAKWYACDRALQHACAASLDHPIIMFDTIQSAVLALFWR